jgi:hypothetical protein
MNEDSNEIDLCNNVNEYNNMYKQISMKDIIDENSRMRTDDSDR